jgi:tetratricopeptide (TPR) repeat protein
LAFLLAYKGSLTKALAEYKRASKRHLLNQRGLLEIEDFICWVVEKEPDKTQLHFCLGLINYFAKGDREQALHDFEKFLETTPSDQFVEQRKLAEAYIQGIIGEARAASRSYSEGNLALST